MGKIHRWSRCVGLVGYEGKVKVNRLIKMEELEYKVILENYKTSLKGYIQSNQAMIEFSKMALRGAMILNGAAIIPIVYSKVEYLYGTALWFGLGALLAACATSMTYLVQWAATTGWSIHFIRYPFRTLPLSSEAKKGVQRALFWTSKLFYLRLAAMGLVAGSLITFGMGLYQAHIAISSMQKQQSTIQSKENTILPSKASTSSHSQTPSPSPKE